MRRAAALAALVLGAWATPAQAAGVGATDLEQQPTAGCAAYPCSIVGAVRADGTAEAGSPIDGILTSVRLRYAGNGAAGVVRVLRPGAGGTFLNDGPEIPLTLTDTAGAAAVVETAVRRPVLAGDRLALGADASFTGDLFVAEGDPRACLVAGAHPVGTTEPYAACAGEPLVQGTVEPDADADGYGDESQDGCPTDAAIHDAVCSADLALDQSADVETAMLFDPVTFTFTVQNRGSSPAEHVGIKVPVVDRAQLRSATTSVGRCAGVRTVFCWLGTLQPGATATVRATVVPGSPGSLSIRSGITSSTLDPNGADNLASAHVTVIDPFKGLGLRDQTVRAKRGFAHVLHTCPRMTARFCQGVVALRRFAGGRRLGRARFQLQPGARARIPVKLSARALRRLAKERRLELLVATQGINGAGTKRTTRAALTLLAEKTGKR